METSGYSARQRRAINQVWTACGDYKFEPQFLAMQSDGQPDLYMNCVIGLVHKWFGDELPKQLFAAWAGDARQAVYDDLAWLALENAVYGEVCHFRIPVYQRTGSIKENFGTYSQRGSFSRAGNVQVIAFFEQFGSCNFEF